MRVRTTDDIICDITEVFVKAFEWHPTTLVQRKKGGNWQVQMNVPQWARDAFGRNQHRKSAGTSDKRIAEARQHDIEDQMRNLADLELIRRNHGVRPSEEEVEQLLRGLRKVLLNGRPKGHHTIEDVLPEFEKHLEGRVRNDVLRQKTMDEWLTFVPQFVKTVGNLPLGSGLIEFHSQ